MPSLLLCIKTHNAEAADRMLLVEKALMPNYLLVVIFYKATRLHSISNEQQQTDMVN